MDEFKKQLETMHENLSSSSEKMQELHEKMRMLKELFKRIDQAEVRLFFVLWILYCVVMARFDLTALVNASREMTPALSHKIFC